MASEPTVYLSNSLICQSESLHLLIKSSCE